MLEGVQAGADHLWVGEVLGGLGEEIGPLGEALGAGVVGGRVVWGRGGRVFTLRR